MDKETYFVFSDESGSWHDKANVYIRSWIVITKAEYTKLKNVILKINEKLGSRELKWMTLANNKIYFGNFDDIDYRVFITVSSPNDINWEAKYKIVRNYDQNIDLFDFGEINKELKAELKKKIFEDIKYILFLNFYERFHIENASKRIEQIIKPSEYNLIYRIDPPQMLKRDWKNILKTISNKELEFPKSDKDEGIQFADVIAGCFSSLCMNDRRYSLAKNFFVKIKDKFIPKNIKIPNPNLIFYNEINSKLKENVKKVWTIEKTEI